MNEVFWISGMKTKICRLGTSECRGALEGGALVEKGMTRRDVGQRIERKGKRQKRGI